MMKVFWYCEQCQKAGIAVINHTDVMAVTYAIIDAHKKVSYDCGVHYTEIKTLNFSAILPAFVPNWAVEPLVKAIEAAL